MEPFYSSIVVLERLESSIISFVTQTNQTHVFIPLFSFKPLSQIYLPI